MHCTFSVVVKLGFSGGNASPPASRSSVRTIRKPVPYRTLCISYRSTRSRDVLVPFAGSPRGLQCLNPISFAGDSSSTSSQKEGGGARLQRVRVAIVLV